MDFIATYLPFAVLALVVAFAAPAFFWTAVATSILAYWLAGYIEPPRKRRH